MEKLPLKGMSGQIKTLSGFSNIFRSRNLEFWLSRTAAWPPASEMQWANFDICVSEANAKIWPWNSWKRKVKKTDTKTWCFDWLQYVSSLVTAHGSSCSRFFYMASLSYILYSQMSLCTKIVNLHINLFPPFDASEAISDVAVCQIQTVADDWRGIQQVIRQRLLWILSKVTLGEVQRGYDRNASGEGASNLVR